MGENDTKIYIRMLSESRKRGVSILTSEKLRKKIAEWEHINENILKVNLEMYGRRFTIHAISHYEPVVVKDQLFEKLDKFRINIGNSREIITLGDLNIRTGKTSNDEVVGPFGENNVNANSKRCLYA